MKEVNYEIKFHTSILCDALHRNINDNFKNISFEIDTNLKIQVKFLLDVKTEVETEYINDIIAEFESLLEINCVKSVIVTTDLNSQPLKNIVYQRSEIL